MFRNKSFKRFLTVLRGRGENSGSSRFLHYFTHDRNSNCLTKQLDLRAAVYLIVVVIMLHTGKVVDWRSLAVVAGVVFRKEALDVLGRLRTLRWGSASVRFKSP